MRKSITATLILFVLTAGHCAADVTVFNRGNDVVIAPDYSRNWWGPHSIEIFPSWNNSGFWIKGVNGTLVGGTVYRFVGWPPDDLLIELPYGGKHSIRIENFDEPGFDDIRVSGHTFVGLRDVHLNRDWHSEFYMDGDQFGAISCSFRRDLNVRAASGSQLTTVSVGRDAYLPAGPCREFVEVGGNLNIVETGTEAFETHLSTVNVVGELYYRGSGGDDFISLTAVDMGRLKMSLGHGNDFVSFRSCDVASWVYVDGGPGDDTAADLGRNNFTLHTGNTDNMEF